MEEQVVQQTPIVQPAAEMQQAPEMELEEEVIQTVEGEESGALVDVIPCEPVVFEEQGMAYDTIGSSSNGLYDGEGYTTPIVSIDQMVDIAPHDTVISSGYELEEVFIPQEDNRPDDAQLDDIVV
mgnify:CR=1 FL=1